MSNPSVNALQRVRKIMGYVKGTMDFAVVLHEPEGGPRKVGEHWISILPA